MNIKPNLKPAEVDELVTAAQRVLALFGVLCDSRHNTLREQDSECLSQEGVGFVPAFYEPKNELERAIRKVRAY